MGKKSKEHRKKVAKRNQKIQQGMRAFEKARTEYMEFLEKSKKESNNSGENLAIPGVNSPTIMPGPQI